QRPYLRNANRLGLLGRRERCEKEENGGCYRKQSDVRHHLFEGKLFFQYAEYERHPQSSHAEEHAQQAEVRSLVVFADVRYHRICGAVDCAAAEAKQENT